MCIWYSGVTQSTACVAADCGPECVKQQQQNFYLQLEVEVIDEVIGWIQLLVLKTKKLNEIYEKMAFRYCMQITQDSDF